MTFVGGPDGNDVMSPNKGSVGDPSEFILSTKFFGKEIISGFNPSKDVIQLSKNTVTSYDIIHADTSKTHGSALITLSSSQSITLTGVDASTPHASNFQFL